MNWEQSLSKASYTRAARKLYLSFKQCCRVFCVDFAQVWLPWSGNLHSTGDGSCGGSHGGKKGGYKVCVCVCVCICLKTPACWCVGKESVNMLELFFYTLIVVLPIHFWLGTTWVYTSSIKHTKFNKNSQNLFCVCRCHVWTKSWNLMTNGWNNLHFLERTCKLVTFD